MHECAWLMGIRSLKDQSCHGVFVQTWFGPGVRSIVEGETRFSKIGNYKEASPEEPIDLKALDLQQLFLAMTEEVRPCSPCLK